MLTLQRFQALLDIYGADFRRWPEEARGAAEALLSISAEARALLEEEGALDVMIAAASSYEEGRRWRTGEPDVAMARLRARVSTRIAVAEVSRPSWPQKRFGRSSAGKSSAVAYNLRWVGFATTGAFAVLAGLAVGALYESAPPTPSVLSVLVQPTAFTILEN
jgi:hypothetical protein